MKTKRGYFVVGGVVVLVVGLILAGWAVANEYSEFRSCFKKGPGCILERMDEGVEELNLTRSQRHKYEALKTELKTNLTDSRAKRREFLNRLKQEINTERPDLTAVANLIKSKMDEMSVHLGQGLDGFVEFYNVLDGDQQEKMIAHLREKIDRFEKFGPPHHRLGHEKRPRD
ncbi:MAG: Spy/CpxP family protein refolding chaperone [Deltaproteobacteria bacterium]|nr:Spy/CpxP family protein refolding chaperone [Deltaproteobacteria bacterium]